MGLPDNGEPPGYCFEDKDQKRAVTINTAAKCDSNIRKKEQEKLENHQGLTEHLSVRPSVPPHAHPPTHLPVRMSVWVYV